MYDAKLTDSKWNGDWEVRTETCADGWRSVARIPLKMMGMTLLESNRLNALMMLTVVSPEKKSQATTWGGGKVHSPDSFGDLILDLE